LEWYDLDAKLVLVLLDRVLGVVWTVEFLAFAVLSWACVVATNDEVGCAIVLADDSMPDGFAGATHSHGEWEEAKNGHAVRVSWEQGLVDTDTGEVIDVSRFREPDDWVDKDICLTGTSCADSQLSVSSVHGVSGLESDDLGPAEFVEVKTEFCGGIY
jgi:hypothetical protein